MNFSETHQPRKKLRLLQPQYYQASASNFLDSASSFCCRHHVHRCGWTRVLKRDQHDVHRRPHGGHRRRAFKLAPPHRPQGQPQPPPLIWTWFELNLADWDWILVQTFADDGHFKKELSSGMNGKMKLPWAASTATCMDMGRFVAPYCSDASAEGNSKKYVHRK